MRAWWRRVRGWSMCLVVAGWTHATAHAQPTPLVDCTKARYHSPNSLRSLLSWAKSHEDNLLRRGSSNPSYDCAEAIRLLGSAYCKSGRDPSIAGRLRSILAACRRWTGGGAPQGSAAGRSAPVVTSPDVRHAIRMAKWAFARAQADARDMERVMKLVEKTLASNPGDPSLTAWRDKLVAAYYGMSVQEAAALRKRGLRASPLEAKPRPQVLRVALDLLLGRKATVDGKLALSYADLVYVYRHVYWPLLRSSKEAFHLAACSQFLRKMGKNYFTEAAKRMMRGRSWWSRCPPKLELKLRDVLFYPRLRLVLARLVARQMPGGAKLKREVVAEVARQVGYEVVPVCWKVPIPGSSGRPKVVTGKSCAADVDWQTLERIDSVHRPFPFAPAFRPKPLSAWTYLQIREALDLLAANGVSSGPLVAELKRALPRAKRYVCFVKTVELRQTYSNGSWEDSGVGDDPFGHTKRIPCSRVRRNRRIARRVGEFLNDFFNEVVGGKFLGGWGIRKYKAIWDKRGYLRKVPHVRARWVRIYIRRTL